MPLCHISHIGRLTRLRKMDVFYSYLEELVGLTKTYYNNLTIYANMSNLHSLNSVIEIVYIIFQLVPKYILVMNYNFSCWL